MGKIMHLGSPSSGGGEIIDNLLSTASSLALSANQGRILNEKIEGISGGDEWDSTQAYSIDDYAIYQNKLYQCIANTTAGIVPTNTTYWKPISIKELNTNLVPQGGTLLDGVITYYKCANLCNVTIDGNVSFTRDVIATIANLPSGFRPITMQHITCKINIASNGESTSVTVKSNGDIQANGYYRRVSETINLVGSITFVCQ